MVPQAVEDQEDEKERLELEQKAQGRLQVLECICLEKERIENKLAAKRCVW
jgi:hypothetical protein